jgi:hypothetical protein
LGSEGPTALTDGDHIGLGEIQLTFHTKVGMLARLASETQRQLQAPASNG